jgi:hypothetical protein
MVTLLSSTRRMRCASTPRSAHKTISGAEKDALISAHGVDVVGDNARIDKKAFASKRHMRKIKLQTTATCLHCILR